MDLFIVSEIMDFNWQSARYIHNYFNSNDVMKLVLLTKSKRTLQNVLFDFPVTYLNEFSGESKTFCCVLYKEKADVYPEVDFYCELYDNDKCFAKLKVILSVAEKRIAKKNISLEYFSSQIYKIFESFRGKQILKEYIDGAGNAEERPSKH